MLITTPRAVPESTLVPWKHAFESSRATFAPGGAPVLFSTGMDSPVRALWLTKKSFVATSRTSAGTSVPASSTTTSPGTICASAISDSFPSRMTFTVVRTMAWSFSTARPDRSSWMEERPTLMSTMPPTTMVERTSPMMKATTAMIRSWMTRGFANLW